MKKYRKIQEILVFKWNGKDSVIEEINETLKPFNEKYNDKFVASRAYNDKDILCLSHKIDGGTATSFLRIGEYAVFDESDFVLPFKGYTEENLKQDYIEIKNQKNEKKRIS
jgi:hypothetical protein